MRRVLVVLFLFCSSCKEKDKYVHKVAYVDSTKHVHRGQGFYKLYVYYSLKDQGQVVNSIYVHKLEQIWSATYWPGDSIHIGYNREEPNKSYIIDISHRAKRE